MGSFMAISRNRENIEQDAKLGLTIFLERRGLWDDENPRLRSSFTPFHCHKALLTPKK